MALTARQSAFDRGRCVCRIEMQFLPGAALWSPHPSHFCRSGGSCRSSIQAIVAELADAHGSGPCTRKGVGVRVPSMAPGFLLIRSPSPRSGFRLRAPLFADVQTHARQEVRVDVERMRVESESPGHAREIPRSARKTATFGISPMASRSQSPNCTRPAADAFAGTPL